MYNAEVRSVVKALDRALDNLSRAEYIIRKSESKSKNDADINNELWAEGKRIRETRNKLRQLYAGMDD